MNQTYRFTFTKPFWLLVVALLALLATGEVSQAQEGSQGNTTVMGGAHMTLFGNHNFVAGGTGTQNGIIKTIRTTPFGIVNYTAGASHSSSSNTGHIDGYVGKYGTTAFTFPIGNGTKLRPISISAPTSGDFRAAYWFSNPNAATLPAGAPFLVGNRGVGVSSVSNIEYWDVDGPSAINLTLSWDAASGLANLTGGAIANLIVVGYNTSTSRWESLGRAGGTTGTLATTGTITANGVTPNTYRAFTFASACDLGNVAVVLNRPTVCVGTTATFTATPTGTGPFTYQWQYLPNNGTIWETLPTATTTHTNGITSGAGTATLSMTPSNTVWNSGQLRVVVTNSIANCSVTSGATRLQVQAMPTIATQPVNKNVCAGGAETFSVTAAGTGPFTYQWQLSTNGGTTWANVIPSSAGAAYSGNTTATMTLTNIQIGANNYRYRAVVAGSGAGCTVTSNTAALTVTNAPTISSQPVAKNVCAGGATTFSVTAAGTGTFTYQWQLSTNGGTTWANVIPSSAGAAYSGNTTATLTLTNIQIGANNYRYRAIVTGSGCSVTSNGAALVVNNAPTISSQPVVQNICVGGTATFSVTAAGTGTLSYQWQYLPNNGTNWETLPTAPTTHVNGITSGAGTASLTMIPSSTEWHNSRLRVIVKNSNNCEVISNVATFTVNALPSIASQPVPRTVCVNSPTTFSVTPSGTGSFRYQWQWNKNGTTNWVDLSADNITGSSGSFSGAGTATLSMTPANLDWHNSRLRVIVKNSNNCEVISNVATFTVNALPTIATQPVPRTVCVNSPTTFSVTPSGTGSFRYQWQWNKNGTTNWVDLSADNITGSSGSFSGAGTATLSMTPANLDWHNSRLRVIVKNSSNCEVISNVATFTVNALPTIATQPVPQTVCAGGSTTFSVAAAGTGSFSYQWQLSTNGGTTWANVIPSSAGAAYSGNTTATLTLTNIQIGANNYRYRAIVTGAGCTVTSNGATLGINNAPTISSQPVVQNICVGGTATFSVTAAGTGTLSYQWQFLPNNGTNWETLPTAPTTHVNGISSGAGTASLSMTPSSTEWNNSRLRLIVKNSSNCEVISNVATFNVNALPVISTQPVAKNVCAGATDTFSVTASGTGPITYQWQLSTNGGTTWANVIPSSAGAAYSGNTTATLTLTNIQIGANNYRYRAIVTAGSTGCSVTSNSATLQVATIPTAPTVRARNVSPQCPQTFVDLTLQLTSNTPSGGSVAFYTSPTPSQETRVSNPNQAGAGTYYAFYTNATCTSPASASITVAGCSLPVTLSSFTLNKDESASLVLLNWTTTSESNSDYFEVQRSADGKQWSKIGTEVSNGESTKLEKYSFTDQKPLSGENLYRLKMVDLDGTFAYSNIRSITFEKIIQAFAYPNPATDRLLIKGYEYVKQVTLHNMSGVKVIDSDKIFSEGIDVRHLMPGMYVIGITLLDGTIQTNKVVIGQ